MFSSTILFVIALTMAWSGVVQRLCWLKLGECLIDDICCWDSLRIFCEPVSWDSSNFPSSSSQQRENRRMVKDKILKLPGLMRLFSALVIVNYISMVVSIREISLKGHWQQHIHMVCWNNYNFIINLFPLRLSSRLSRIGLTKLYCSFHYL